MTEQRRIGFKWHLRHLMAHRNLWKSTELHALLKSRGINLSESQVYRLVTGAPERIPARTFAALCDILDCAPGRPVRALRRDASCGHRRRPAAQRRPRRPARRPDRPPRPDRAERR
ncbi:helix-turn-helix transcriptional regulator [Kribbella sp. NPDC050820]|uniref:helix-turn-helix domain-containing protein n=1 Tax=Kribbella sp. NPDC050820 TaxID=3155408 RepID=UPI0033DAD92E